MVGFFYGCASLSDATIATNRGVTKSWKVAIKAHHFIRAVGVPADVKNTNLRSLGPTTPSNQASKVWPLQYWRPIF